MAEEKRPEWMSSITGIVDPEEYLLGRKIDKTFELSQKEKADKAKEARIDLLSKDRIKLTEDPILDLERQRRELKMEIIRNPVLLKQLRDKLLREDREKAAAAGETSREQSSREDRVNETPEVQVNPGASDRLRGDRNDERRDRHERSRESSKDRSSRHLETNRRDHDRRLERDHRDHRSSSSRYQDDHRSSSRTSHSHRHDTRDDRKSNEHRHDGYKSSRDRDRSKSRERHRTRDDHHRRRSRSRSRSPKHHHRTHRHHKH